LSSIQTGPFFALPSWPQVETFFKGTKKNLCALLSPQGKQKNRTEINNFLSSSILLPTNNSKNLQKT